MRNFGKGKVDALQLELGMDLRTVEARESTCQKLAGAIMDALNLPYYK